MQFHTNVRKQYQLFYLMQCVPRIVQESNMQLVDNEWRELPCYKLNDVILKATDDDVFWHLVSQIKNDAEEYLFKHLSSFVLQMLSLPHSNASCERLFSRVNLIKTDIRNKIITPTINGLLLTQQAVKTDDGTCITFKPTIEMRSLMNKTLYDHKKETEIDQIIFDC